MDLILVIGNVACWGTVILVWIAGAAYNALRVPSARVRAPAVSPMYLGAIVLCVIVTVPPRGFLSEYLSVGAVWARLIGLTLLVVATVFTLRARFALGTMWSVGPRVGGDGRLRTSGPYAVTRHPIYTGLLGMLLGTALFAGAGQWLILPAIGLIIFEAKIHDEEHLLLATFPAEYPAYRRHVPQLVPRPWMRERR